MTTTNPSSSPSLLRRVREHPTLAAALALNGPDRASALTMLLLPFLGLAASLHALRPDAAHAVPHDLRSVASGTTFRMTEARLEADLPGRAVMVGVANTARYLAVRGGTDEVTVGRDGWLFLRSELAVHPQEARDLHRRADLIVDLSGRLRARGVTLLVAVSPNKSRVQQAFLPGRHLPAWSTDTYRAFQALLRARGVSTVDLLTPMTAAARAQTQYYRTDTHWNQAGARTAAAAVARTVRAAAPDLPAATFVTAADPMAARPGDLQRLMGLQDTPDGLRPPADREAQQHTVASGGSLGAGLLGAAPQVVLAGSSYGLRGNFHGALQQALGSTVVNVSREGADFSGSLRTYLRDPAFRDAPPRVLVWEIPERFLPVPLADEDRRPLMP
ncbi:alginate O-acetyltransferase AlgX-related protein [Deinococcus aquiradiocola]|uniref:Cell division protein FtsQ n=1 Tax=Deinococcus aquiradiocola TaxID=393059 RepID=A0A917ULV8_9DEIO|nr:cell division protein FtsQ [Deinococcus aquiradiocola]GGJ66948.1 cell division protein FtsQ [Deinococcus aquiradiocola]